MKKFINKYLLFLITSFALTLSINVNSVLADEEYRCEYETSLSTYKISMTMYHYVNGDNDDYRLKDCKVIGDYGKTVVNNCDFFYYDYFTDEGFQGVIDEYGRKGTCPPKAFYYKANSFLGFADYTYVGFGREDLLQSFIDNHKKEDGDGNDVSQILSLKQDLDSIKQSLLSKIADTNKLIDDFLNSSCDEISLGSTNSESCKSKKQSIINIFNNDVVSLYKDAIDAGMEDLTDISKVASCKKDEICKPYSLLKTRISDTESDFNKYKIGTTIKQITCNYSATINGKNVNLYLKTQNQKGNSLGTDSVSLTGNYSPVFGEARDYVSAKHKYIYGNAVIFPNTLNCLPKIGYKVTGNNIDFVSEDMLTSLRKDIAWSNNFTLKSVSYDLNGETVEVNINNLVHPLENVVYNTGNNIRYDWIFGGSNYLDTELFDKDGNSSGDNNLNLDGCIIDADTQSIIDWVLNMVRLVGIILMIVLGMLDFIKAAASGEQEEMKKSRTKFVKRLIACVVLFLIPIIVNILLGLINMGSGANCS